LGAYYNLTKMSLGMREIQFHDLTVDLITKLPTNKYKVLIFDTWTRFENTFQPKVQKNPTLFREFYSPMGSIKGAEMWKASFDYEAAIIDKLLQVAPLVILVTHLKDQSVGSVKTAKEIPDCKKPVVEKSRIRLWLHHNPDNPAPIGLVLKRLSKIIVGENGLEAVNVLPRKINPCTWNKLLDYWQNPVGDRLPKPEETPNEFELSILDGVLTEDQKDILHINRVESDRPKVETMASAEPPEEPKETISSLLEKHGAVIVMKALQEVTGGAYPQTMEEIRKVRDTIRLAQLGYSSDGSVLPKVFMPAPAEISASPTHEPIAELVSAENPPY